MITDFEFRPLTQADFELLHEWLNRPHVAKWWNGVPSLEDVRAKYLPRLESGPVRPYIAYLDDEPIGYIQSYLAADVGGGWWPDEQDSGVVGIDLYIGDPERLGQGVGTAMVSQFVARLFRDPTVTHVQADPQPDNPRAIRCYEKAGFHQRSTIETPNGPAVLMLAERNAFTLEGGRTR